MTALGWIVFIVYFIGIQLVGWYGSRGNKTSSDYFLGGQKLPWWAVSFSIVATETSSLTFISIPAVGYTGDLSFMQIVFGYFVGRLLVAFFFLPHYFKAPLETIYHFLEKFYSTSLRKNAAIVFSVTRLLADGVRLFVTAIPLAIIMDWYVGFCIIIFVLATIPYTLLGGIRSVVFTDALQMLVYVGAGLLVVYRLWPGIENVPAQKWNFFASGLSNGLGDFFSHPYYFIGAVLGGGVLSMFTHGTEQLSMQRVLALGCVSKARKAIIFSGVLVAIQFLLFLLIGLGLYGFFNGKKFETPDTIFPLYIVRHLPPLLKALLIAAIFASAQSTLSSSLNSLASSTFFDIFPGIKNKPESKKLNLSRWATLFWAVALAGFAISIQEQNSPVVILGLKITSIPAGVMIAFYINQLFFKRKEFKTERKLTKNNFFAHNIILFFSLGLMVFIVFFTKLAWVWFAPVGLLLTLGLLRFENQFLLSGRFHK